MNVGSLFSGIGGIDLGLERAGMHVAWQCEADEYRRAVLAHRFPGVECSIDVRGVGIQQRLSRHPGRRDGASAEGESERSGDRVGANGVCGVDLVCGGFPCQDLSVAGRRAGLNGSRSSLFFEFARIADLVLPPGGWLLLENVPGLLSSQGGRDFAVVLATLAELGFHDLAWRILDSRHFGVAQRRRRVYILARRARGDRACQVLLEPEGSAGDPQTRRKARSRATPRSLAGTLGGGNNGAGRRSEFDPNLVSTLQDHKTGGYRIDAEGASGGHLIADTLTSGSHPASNMPGRRREDDTNLVAFDTYNQSVSDQVQTLRDPNGTFGDALPAAATASGVRRLTPRECERLQGFPDDWTLIPGASDSKRYAALGDAVTVPVAEWIGRRMMEAT